MTGSLIGPKLEFQLRARKPFGKRCPIMAVALAKLAPATLLAAGLLGYHNALHGPFIFDDIGTIPENPFVRQLWPPWKAMSAPPEVTTAGRPVAALSFALNYAAGKLDVRGYHAVNIALHIGNALLLQALLRRTVGPGLSLAVALVWLLHPLHTETVNYIVQRTELLMAMFVLLTLYCAVRGWQTGAVIACALGVASKETAAVTPLLVWVYDALFLSRNWREPLRRRPGMYAGLAASWLLLAALLASVDWSAKTGFGFEHLSPWQYLLTQSTVIAHYLRLSLWPHPLVLDYVDWPIARSVREVIVPGLFIVALLALSAWALARRYRVAFLGVWFFLLLAPASSFIPLASEPMAERRMYLPVASVIVAAALAAQRWLPRPVCVAVLAAVCAGFGAATLARNTQYRTAVSIWADTVAKRPGNARAHYNLGVALREAGRTGEAMRAFAEAVRLRPDVPDAWVNLGLLLVGQGRLEDGIAHYRAALRARPDYYFAHLNLGAALHQQGKLEEAIAHYRLALRVNPQLVQAHLNLALALHRQGHRDEARRHLEAALAIDAGFDPARRALEILQSESPKR
jgi:tetratricopeptide (TPR) repeat protein